MGAPREDDDRRAWDTSPLHDVPVGPDQAGDGVAAALNALVAGWRWLRRRLARSREV